jgi:hypothetical protein
MWVPSQRLVGFILIVGGYLGWVFFLRTKREWRPMNTIGIFPFIWILGGILLLVIGFISISRGINLAWPPIAATQQLGKELKVFSQELIEFADERKRAEMMLPRSDKPENFYRDWQIRVNFSRETEALFNRKYGGKWAKYLAELKHLGINPPFQVVTAISHNIGVLGKYLNVMGSFLEENKIKEAQENSKDENFWFRQ